MLVKFKPYPTKKTKDNLLLKVNSSFFGLTKELVRHMKLEAGKMYRPVIGEEDGAYYIGIAKEGHPVYSEIEVEALKFDKAGRAYFFYDKTMRAALVGWWKPLESDKEYNGIKLYKLVKHSAK